MLGFIISSAVFYCAVSILNRYWCSQKRETSSGKLQVMIVATVVSIGAGWLVDKIDGDSESAQSKMSFEEIIQTGDPLKIAKLIVGIN